MFKRMLVLCWQYLRVKRLGPVGWLGIIILVSLLVHCVHRAHRSVLAQVPIIYQGGRLIVPENSALRRVVQVEPVHPESVVTTVVVPATVQAIPAKTVAIFPPVSGQITRIFKALGDSVKEGEPLYALVSPDLAQIIAERTSALANYTFAEKNLKRQKELARFEINALRELEQAESEMLQSEAELKRCTARLQAFHLKLSDQDTHGRLLMRAPCDGVVTAINSGVGSYWSDLSQPILTIANLSEVYLVASAQEHDLPDFFLGQDVEVVFERPTQSFSSTVSFIDPVLNSDTRTVDVGMVIDNQNAIMRPNMFARVKFHRKPRQRILLPMTAVVQRGFDSIAFVEVAPWEFEPRVVRVGLQLNDKIEIESGLVDKERVAMTGGIILND